MNTKALLAALGNQAPLIIVNTLWTVVAILMHDAGMVSGAWLGWMIGLVWIAVRYQVEKFQQGQDAALDELRQARTDALIAENEEAVKDFQAELAAYRETD